MKSNFSGILRCAPVVISGSFLLTTPHAFGQVVVGGTDYGSTVAISSDVTASSISIAPVAGTSGTLTILSSFPNYPFGSRLDLTGGPISIGDGGTGILNVAAGLVSSPAGVPFIVGNHSGSLGQVNVTGYTQSIPGGGSISNSGALYISGNTILGNEAGSSGTIAVSSGDSAYFFGSLTVGEYGAGVFSTQSAYNAVNGSLTIGNRAGSSGTLDVDFGNLQAAALGGDYAISIGYLGSGTATVSHGATLNSATSIFVGDQLGSHGQLTVTGSGSTVQATAFIDIGQYGIGTGLVENGGKFVSGLGVWVGGGYVPGETSTLTVKGNGSSAEITNDLKIGRAGTGVLNVLDGATLTMNPWSAATATNSIVVGTQSTGIGYFNVDGVGSHAELGTRLEIGRFGEGHMQVSGGATVNLTDPEGDPDNTDPSLQIGNHAGSVGTLLITGAGSQLNVTGRAEIGVDGLGQVTISNGGLLHVGGTSVVIGGGSGTGTVSVSSGGILTIDHYLALGADTGSGSLVINGGTAQAATTFIGSVAPGNYTMAVSNGGVFQSTDNVFVGGDGRDFGFGPWPGGSGQLLVQNTGTVSTHNLDVIRGNVVVDGGILQATTLTNETNGLVLFRSGLITTTSTSNRGLFNINSSDATSASVVGAFTNVHGGITTVALGDNSQVTFQGNVVNHGTMEVSQRTGSSGGSAVFTGTFTNAADGIFVQDPTATHFTSLVNNGTFTAGLGDSIWVDLGLLNTGSFNLTGTFLHAGGGIQNDGAFNIFGGATLDGLYSGTGNLVFHVTSSTDRLTLDDFFNGSIAIVFDNGYLGTGLENFLFFGSGANLTDLNIGGRDYRLGPLTGPGFITGNGSFAAFTAVPEPSAYAFAGAAALLALIYFRRRARSAR